MTNVISIVWFLIILSVIVICHEGGHFLLARLHGIRVKEFAVGMGPTILHFKKGETVYSLKLLPLGGACIFDGEDGIGEDGKDDEHSFNNANVWHRISTVLAGPVFNFILAMLFAVIIVANCGSDLPVISGLTEGRPAENSGLCAGDSIIEINGEKIHIWRDISLISILNTGEPLKVKYKRDDRVFETTIVPAYEASENRYYIGIEGGITYIEFKGLNLVGRECPGRVGAQDDEVGLITLA